MNLELAGAFIAAATAVIVALISLFQSLLARRDTAHQSTAQMEHERRLKDVESAQQRQLRILENELEQRRMEQEYQRKREEVVNRFREPLARAAYDLQSRLWNTLSDGFMDAYLVHGNAREQAYAIENTAFVIAQYFAWTEIVRREIQFIDLQEESETAKLAHMQDEISNLWGSDHPDLGTQFRIWAGEQRAIGELLIDDTDAGPRCVGYARFVELLHASRSPFLDVLTAEVRTLPQHTSSWRLVRLQHALIDQLHMLDPKCIRFPGKSRSKVVADTGSPLRPLHGPTRESMREA